jgi:hypothetical protein
MHVRLDGRIMRTKVMLALYRYQDTDIKIQISRRASRKVSGVKLV